MSALATLARTETRLHLRDPMSVGPALALPTLILLGLGAVPALREPAEVFGGMRFVEVFAPTLLAVGIATLGLQGLPTTLAVYRERGVLRRMSTTPMSPLSVLGVQLMVNLATAAAGTVLLVGAAALALDVPPPRHPVAFAGTLLLGTSAVFALGLVIAAVAPRAKAAAVVGTLASMLVQLFAGVYLPHFLLPDVLVRVSAFVPPGVEGIRSAWVGDGPAAAPLLVMVVVTVAATAAASRLFRWE